VVSEPLLLDGIEAGGTKFLGAVADRDGRILAETRIAPRTPAKTLGAASDFFRDAQQVHGGLSAFSIGSFGPLPRDPLATDYGYITSTSRPGWENWPAMMSACA